MTDYDHIHDLATVLADTASDTGPHFTCTEATTIYDALIALRMPFEANTWIDGHAAGDECGDDHHVCDDCRDDDTTPPSRILDLMRANGAVR